MINVNFPADYRRNTPRLVVANCSTCNQCANQSQWVTQAIPRRCRRLFSCLTPVFDVWGGRVGESPTSHFSELRIAEE